MFWYMMVVVMSLNRHTEPTTITHIHTQISKTHTYLTPSSFTGPSVAHPDGSRSRGACCSPYSSKPVVVVEEEAAVGVWDSRARYTPLSPVFVGGFYICVCVYQMPINVHMHIYNIPYTTHQSTYTHIYTSIYTYNMYHHVPCSARSRTASRAAPLPSQSAS